MAKRYNWFRFYSEVLRDPKVQLLSCEMFRSWVNLLCLASENSGYLPALQHVSFAFHETEDVTQTTIEHFRKIGLLDERYGRLTPHNWFKRQYKSDSSTNRVKEFRERQRNVSATSSETDTETETDTEEKGSTDAPDVAPKRPKKSAAPDPAFEAFAEAYHVNIGSPYGVQSGDFPQLAKLRKRLKIERPDVPDCYDSAILNYFASEIGEFSLQHFASKFDTFKHSSIDRFKVPKIQRSSNGSRSKPKESPEETELYKAQRCEAIHLHMQRDFDNGLRKYVPTIDEIRNMIDKGEL